MKPGRVLDVGCGTGENAIFLAQNGFSVTGIDLVRDAIQMAKAKVSERKLKVEFLTGNALATGFDREEFDYVTDSGLFHTFADKERPIFAGEIARVLRGNGTYYMLCFSDKEPTDWGGPRRVSRKEIRETFSPMFRVNYVRDAFFADRFRERGGKAYLTSASKRTGNNPDQSQV